MTTKTGKAIAEHRHEAMENFLEEFKQEWDSILYYNITTLFKIRMDTPL